MIEVVNKKTHVPTNRDFYVGRGSALGNPYTSIPGGQTKAEFTCSTREESISKFHQYLLEKIKSRDKEICDELNKIWQSAKNGDINLVCYCVPETCHATIIKKVIESKMKPHKTYVGRFTNFTKKHIFVFGSNTQGRHGKGAAKVALLDHGAKYGQARGLQGQSYAIITKDLTQWSHPSRTEEQIKEEIKELYDFAVDNPELEFVIPYNTSSDNLNFYSAQEMANFFGAFEIPKNIIFEVEFYSLIK